MSLTNQDIDISMNNVVQYANQIRMPLDSWNKETQKQILSLTPPTVETVGFPGLHFVRRRCSQVLTAFAQNLQNEEKAKEEQSK